MNALESRARIFFLRCRILNQSSKWRTLPSRRLEQFRKFTNSVAKCQGSVKPYYVTSPIFYVNAEPHAGHLYTIILTDVLKRWQVLKGDHQAALLTGTDEHGMKIQKAAEKAKINTKTFCDQHAHQFLQLAERANVSFDRFIRTTDQDHKDAVEHFWKALRDRDYIYESKHEGWYSVSDETFYPESQVHLVLDPSTGRKLHASMETGKEVEWTSEINYHFRLSSFKDRLLRHYHENPNFIVPSHRMKFIIKEVENGLQDLSISRPSSRLQWGIKVPDDESQTIYVWLDALINYITMAGYPFEANSERHALWPPNAQVIGKDIIRFHCIYWPAFLMALDLPLPKAFLSHAHWTMNSTKMSKSLGNGVNPFYAMDRYDVDTIRYYMTHDGGIVDDADYDNSFIVEKYKKGLQGGLGNLMSRIVRARKWDVRSAVEAAEQGELAAIPDTATTQLDIVDKTAIVADQLMDELNPRQALRTIMDLVYMTNKYFHESQVWDLTMDKDAETVSKLNQIVFLSAESTRIACILLQPFMPDKMRTALDMLGVDPSRRTFNFAKYGADYSYGKAFIEVAQQKISTTSGTLFPPLATDF